jgi:S-adenosylmethionine uptake transporter
MTADRVVEEPPETQRRPTGNILGILLMLVAFLLHSLSDVGSKMLAESYHPIQLAWTRLLGLLLGVMFLIGRNGTSILRTRHPYLQIFRGLLIVISAIAYLISLAYVPLADAVAVTFVAPFVVIVLAATILKEKVGAARWLAAIIGFAGTLIIIRPGVGVLHPAISLSLIAGAAFAIRQVISRVVAGTDPLATTVVYTTLTAFIILSLPLAFVWSSPATPQHLLLMLGIACLTGTGEYLIMRALDIAQAVVVAPLIYTIMIWSTLWGLIFFGTLPDVWTFAGTALVIGSGIFTIYVDWRASRKKAGG